MIYRLIILNGDRRGEQITLTHDPMTIGRDGNCDISVNDPEIALSHAEISHTPKGLFIRDLGSMNRLLINHRETREAFLKHGDIIEAGHTRFLIQAHVQAEVQGDSDEDDKKEKRRKWLVDGAILLVVVGLIIGIPRCMRFLIAPPAKTVKPRVQVQPLPVPAPLPPPAPLPRPAKPEPVPVPTPKPAASIPITPPPPETSPRVPVTNPQNDVVSASKQDLLAAEELMRQPPRLVTNTIQTPLQPPPPRRAAPPSVGLIKIATTDINKFPETDQFREMRVLSIHLAATETPPEAASSTIRTEVTFIELDPETGMLSPAPPNLQPTPVTLKGSWSASEQKTVTASYMIPAASPAVGHQRHFHGFIARVYCNGVLQDEVRQPRDLPGNLGQPPQLPDSQPPPP